MEFQSSSCGDELSKPGRNQFLEPLPSFSLISTDPVHLWCFSRAAPIIAWFQQTVDLVSIDVDRISNGMATDNDFKKFRMCNRQVILMPNLCRVVTTAKWRFHYGCIQQIFQDTGEHEEDGEGQFCRERRICGKFDNHQHI